MTDRIDVICDDPRHADVPPRKIATYRREGNGVWMVGRGEQKRRLAKRRAQVEASGLDSATMDRAMLLALASEPLRCKLCGLNLRRPRKVPLRQVLNSLAAQGVSRISLRNLIVLASEATKGH